MDINALLRNSVVCNVPVACNRSTADVLTSSPLLGQADEPILKGYSGYMDRDLE